MANDDQIEARGGLWPVALPFGNYQKTLYRLTTSATADVFIGQPMDLDNLGRVVPAGVADNAPVLGPVVGFVDTDKAGLPTSITDLDQAAYLPANKDAYCIIADDPNQVFLIQEDTGSTALAETNIGNTLNMVPRTSSGSTVTGRSTFEADRSTVAADTGGQLTISGLYDIMNSDGTKNAFGNYSKLRVRINHHRLANQPGVSI